MVSVKEKSLVAGMLSITDYLRAHRLRRYSCANEFFSEPVHIAENFLLNANGQETS